MGSEKVEGPEKKVLEGAEVVKGGEKVGGRRRSW